MAAMKAAMLNFSNGSSAMLTRSIRPFIVPIPGTKRTFYLKDNLGAVAVELSDKECEQLNALVSADAVIGDRYSRDGMAILNG